MRKKIFGSLGRLATCAILFGFAATKADVMWNNTTITTDVINDNIIAMGTNTIDGAADGSICVAITADTILFGKVLTLDIAADTILQGNASGTARLYLTTDPGTTILVRVRNNLTFRGNSDANLTPLEIVHTGRGTVRFQLDDGKAVTYTNDVGFGGAAYWELMQSAEIDPVTFTTVQTPITEFVRTSNNSSSDVTIEVGPESLISYLSTLRNPEDNPNDHAFIHFDPTNAGSGRMVLEIEDGGLVEIMGHLVTFTTEEQDKHDITFDSINRSVHAGCQAVLSVENSTCDVCPNPCLPAVVLAPSSLLVVNRNTRQSDFLIDPFCTGCDFDGTRRFGFILVDKLDIGNCAYVDYVATQSNQCPVVTTTCGLAAALECKDISQFTKKRNPSAFIVDGDSDSSPCSRAIIKLGNQSALYFRSGGFFNDSCEWIVNDDFLLDRQNLRTCGIGEIVFDVEAHLKIDGKNPDPHSNIPFVSAIELLSLEVVPTGGDLIIDTTGTFSLKPIFPLRTCAHDECGNFLRYNTGAFFINDRVDLCNVHLKHTDENHLILEKNDCKSEPAYVGGDKWFIRSTLGVCCQVTQDECGIPGCSNVQRPAICFYNSVFDLHFSAAITGMDLCVDVQQVIDFTQTDSLLTSSLLDCCITETVNPGTLNENNCSKFIFYQNGKVCDDCGGRQLILGTLVGAFACDCVATDTCNPCCCPALDTHCNAICTSCDGCSLINADAHLNVIQTNQLNTSTAVPLHQLTLQNYANNGQINCCLREQGNIDISKQYSLHCIYLGQSSNISVGTEHPLLGFTLYSNPVFLIAGNFFAFETRGGPECSPCLSGQSGRGGIFVDNGRDHAYFAILPGFRAFMGTMVTKSGNGVIILPKNQVTWADCVGIAEWKLDLSDEDQQVIIPAGQFLSEYVLNWATTTKDYANFTPYEIGAVDVCGCPVVTSTNIASIPTVEGQVNQLQIKGASLGCLPTVAIKGGNVGELIFLDGFGCGDSSTALIVLEDEGHIGLGSRHRNGDSEAANVQLGVNGVTIISNGNNREEDANGRISGVVRINEDIIVNNICAFLKGPDSNPGDRLVITSDCGKCITVTRNGILDFRSFESCDIIEFTGDVKVILQPGAQIIFPDSLSTCTNVEEELVFQLQFTEQACVQVTPVAKVNEIFDVDFSRQCELGAPTTTILDPYRVKLMGVGNMVFKDCACFRIYQDAFVGVETLTQDTVLDNDLGFAICPDTIVTTSEDCSIVHTDVTITLCDSAQMLIGDDCNINGGAFQVGNTKFEGNFDNVNPIILNELLDDLFQGRPLDELNQHEQELLAQVLVASGNTDIVLHSVIFKLIINGTEATFEIGQQGFFGLDVGIAKKIGGQAPNDWLVDTLFNVGKTISANEEGFTGIPGITIEVDSGIFKHARIWEGNDPRASLFAFGPTTLNLGYVYILDNDKDYPVQDSVLGGGNMVALKADEICPGEAPINPIVGTTDRDDLNGRGTVGIFSSGSLQKDETEDDEGQPTNPTTQALIFNFWATDPQFNASTVLPDTINIRANAGLSTPNKSGNFDLPEGGRNQIRVSYIFGEGENSIRRYSLDTANIYTPSSASIRGNGAATLDPDPIIRRGDISAFLNTETGNIVAAFVYNSN